MHSGFPRRHEAVTADGRSLHSIAEPGDQRPPLDDRRLHRRKLQRGLVTCLALPDLGHPESVRICGVGRDYVTETAGHVAGSIDQDVGESIPLSGDRCHLADQTVHLASNPLRRPRNRSSSTSTIRVAHEGIHVALAHAPRINVVIEADALKHHDIGLAHILLGVLRVSDVVTTTLLDRMAIRMQSIRDRISLLLNEERM
jgi:hypothetical protein